MTNESLTYSEWLCGNPWLIHSYFPIFTQRSTSLSIWTPRKVKYLSRNNQHAASDGREWASSL